MHSITGYVPINRLLSCVFHNRNRIYKFIPLDDPYAEMFHQLKNVSSRYLPFFITTRTQVYDNLYETKWCRDLRSTNLLLRVQLLHVGRTSYSTVNELLHQEDTDHRLAKVVHHVTLIDPEARQPVPLPDDFIAKAQKWAVESELPYKVQLTPPEGDVHNYSTNIRWTDTDSHRHLNTVFYMKYAIDAAYDAIQAGKLANHVDADGTFRIKDFKMRFIRESLQGQEMRMALWEAPGGILNVRMSIDGAVVNESLITAHNFEVSKL